MQIYMLAKHNICKYTCWQSIIYANIHVGKAYISFTPQKKMQYFLCWKLSIKQLSKTLETSVESWLRFVHDQERAMAKVPKGGWDERKIGGGKFVSEDVCQFIWVYHVHIHFCIYVFIFFFIYIYILGLLLNHLPKNYGISLNFFVPMI